MKTSNMKSLVHNKVRFTISAITAAIIGAVVWLLSLYLIVSYGPLGVVGSVLLTFGSAVVTFMAMDRKLWKIQREVMRKHGL